jgi:FKBP-type peptidyl-prolyl cis-trans isomerase
MNLCPVRCLTLISLLILMAPATVLHAQRERLPPDDLDYVLKTWPQAKKTYTGIRYIIERPGEGQPPKGGDIVSILFKGTLLQGALFERELDPKHPFVFRLGREEVITGWDQIVQLMKPGSTWLVIIPPELAYGSRGRAPRVPPDSTLVFEMQLANVQREV